MSKDIIIETELVKLVNNPNSTFVVLYEKDSLGNWTEYGAVSKKTFGIISRYFSFTNKIVSKDE